MSKQVHLGARLELIHQGIFPHQATHRLGDIKIFAKGEYFFPILNQLYKKSQYFSLFILYVCMVARAVVSV